MKTNVFVSLIMFEQQGKSSPWTKKIINLFRRSETRSGLLIKLIKSNEAIVATSGNFHSKMAFIERKLKVDRIMIESPRIDCHVPLSLLLIKNLKLSLVSTTSAVPMPSGEAHNSL